MSRPGKRSIIDQPWPEGDLEHLGRCPLCGSVQRTVLHENLRDRIYHSAPGSWTLHRCEGCGCAYLDPRPTPETVERAYDQYFTHATEEVGITGSRIERAKRNVLNGYLNREWGTSLSPASRVFGMHLPNSVKTLIDEGVMRNLPRPPGGRRLLDVGCGDGQFLSFARSAGWRIAGFDFDPKAIRIARSRGLDVRLGGFETTEHESEGFDAITVSHVIEHVHDPKGLLARCYQLLKPGGYFWIESPNVDSYGHSEFQRDWRGLEPPRHLQLFSWALLKRMLEEAGFLQVTSASWRPEYSTVRCASKAIRRNVIQARLRPTIFDSVWSWFVESGNRIDHVRREFITFQATH